MHRATILAIVLVAGSALSLAQDRALISGDAEDKQDTPISGARVTLRNESLRVERTTTTNSDGLYFFAEVVPAEGYVITADAAGLAFLPQSVKFDVEVGETRHLLPSFIADKLPTPVSGLRRGTQHGLPYRAGRVGGANLAKTGSQPGAPTVSILQKSSQLTPKALSGRIAQARKPVAYVPVRIAATGRVVSAGHDNPRGQDKSVGSSVPAQQGNTPSSAPQQAGSSASSGGGKKIRAQQRDTVESSHVPLDTVSTAVSTVITSNQLRNLPFFNRNFLALGLLDSSTHDVPAWSELKDTTFSISGQRPTSNAFHARRYG